MPETLLLHTPTLTTTLPNLALLLGQIIIVIACARLIGQLFRRYGQPQVIGEMAAGIVLGPTLFGSFAPALSAMIFPPASLGFLQAISQLGMVIFMFIIGLELDPAVLRERRRTSLVVSLASIALPFALGVLLAYWLYPRFGQAHVSFIHFALFIGTAMSITAFPVLARILKEGGLIRTELGALALTCAALNDVAAWFILAAVVILVNAGQHGPSLPIMLGATALYLLVMIKLVRPILARLLHRSSHGAALSQNHLALILVVVLCSALFTEWLGIHALFGAFLAGVIMPRKHGLVDQLVARMEDFTLVMLLPLFFVFTGLRTNIQLLSEPLALIACAVVVLAAVIGKMGGATLAARACGVPWRKAGALGILMNTRGLMELVILNIGLDIGVISPTMFTMLVIMALVTTCMTAPLLKWCYQPRVRAGIQHPDNQSGSSH